MRVQKWQEGNNKEDKDHLAMRNRAAIQLTVLAALTACSQFPELDEAVSDSARDAPYTELVPIETLQAQAPQAAIDDTTQEVVEGRAERLRARASALKPDVIDEESQSRMQNAAQ